MDEEKKSVRHRTPGMGKESANSEGYDEFLSCDEYSDNKNEEENGQEEKKKMGLELDIAAINIDVREENK